MGKVLTNRQILGGIWQAFNRGEFVPIVFVAPDYPKIRPFDERIYHRWLKGQWPRVALLQGTIQQQDDSQPPGCTGMA